jgi:RNA polymerase sigma-70 factor (TIGR02954 family)
VADRQLVISAQKGNDQAFFALMQENKEKLYKIAYSFFKNEEMALEAIQEVTCRAYCKLNRLREPAYFDTWLVRIMLNYCISEQKRQKRLLPQLRNEQAAPGADNDTRIGIEAAVERLEPRYKQIIILKYFQDFTLSEIARVLGCPDGTVKTWLHKALRLLRQDLGKGGEKFHV